MKIIVISGTSAGVGKTTLAIGLMAALEQRGLRVQAFKVGPDFNDPLRHERAINRPSHSLDGIMLTKEYNISTVAKFSSLEVELQTHSFNQRFLDEIGVKNSSQHFNSID